MSSTIPSQKAWNGTPLLGYYEFDYEGVVPAPLTLVEKGKLKSFLLTRQPVKGFEASNGRARVPGPYGANAAAISNLFVRASETGEEGRSASSIPQDGPGSWQTVRHHHPQNGLSDHRFSDELAACSCHRRKGGGSRPVSTPLHVYRVYPDGKEELVRGSALRGLSSRTLRDIVAVSDESFAFHYMNTLAPMSMAWGRVCVADVGDCAVASV